jgi:hypothetical protein
VIDKARLKEFIDFLKQGCPVESDCKTDCESCEQSKMFHAIQQLAEAHLDGRLVEAVDERVPILRKCEVLDCSKRDRYDDKRDVYGEEVTKPSVKVGKEELIQIIWKNSSNTPNMVQAGVEELAEAILARLEGK